ncbi:MAG: nucleoside diphosphate kinase regulator [Gammaproteobacteria bacterium]|nr:nucleoside diphosphate kinase regulator [Gammaproteobacteria bacterium]
MDKKPEIIVSSRDMDRLDALLEALPGGAFPGEEALRAELERARVVAPEEVPANVVTMNSTVRFRMADSGKEFSMTLVYPRDIGEAPDRISILAPVGSALLGLSVGDEIEWPRPGGGNIQLTIAEVLYQPEREGKLRR